MKMTSKNHPKRLLLISNSTLYGSGFLDHAEAEISDFLGNAGGLLFIPFALHDQDTYAEKARERLSRMGYDLDSLHKAPDKHQAVADAAAIFIGGGNTFRHLKALYDFELLHLIKQRVEHGMPYIG